MLSGTDQVYLINYRFTYSDTHRHALIVYLCTCTQKIYPDLIFKFNEDSTRQSRDCFSTLSIGNYVVLVENS